jgi:hypothetical protein
VGVLEAIRHANALLPGQPADEGQDQRWQALIAVAEYIDSDPEVVWSFIRRWGSSSEADLRAGIATCLLEHLLENHFEAYFPRVEDAAITDPMFGDTFQRCWQFGQAEEPGNAERFAALRARH